MPEIRFAALTYKQPAVLKNLYDSLVASYGPLNADNFYIVNNHSQFTSPGPSTVLHDEIRPDYSLGYQSRSWNHGLLHGFVNTARPAAEWVCLVQSDVYFLPDWFARFRAVTADGTVKLVACGPGDQAVFIHIDAFKDIGWFDERLCGNGYQEFDYFLRAYLRLGRRAMIQGHGDQLVWNWPADMHLIARPNVGDGVRVEEKRPPVTQRVNSMLQAHLHWKWGREFFLKACILPETRHNWTTFMDERFGSPELPRTPQQRDAIPREYNWYPYMYMDDPRDYSDLYLAYVSLSTSTVFG